MGLTHTAERLLELPSGALTGEARIEIHGKGQVLIAGQCDIREYEEELVRVMTRSGEVRIRGDRLTLDDLHSGGIAVSGRILCVELE